MTEKKKVVIPDDLPVGQPPEGTPPETVDALHRMEAGILRGMFKRGGIKLRGGPRRP